MSATCPAHLILLTMLEDEYDYCQSAHYVIFCITNYLLFFQVPYHTEVLFFHTSLQVIV